MSSCGSQTDNDEAACKPASKAEPHTRSRKQHAKMSHDKWWVACNLVRAGRSAGDIAVALDTSLRTARRIIQKIRSQAQRQLIPESQIHGPVPTGESNPIHTISHTQPPSNSSSDHVDHETHSNTLYTDLQHQLQPTMSTHKDKNSAMPPMLGVTEQHGAIIAANNANLNRMQPEQNRYGAETNISHIQIPPNLPYEPSPRGRPLADIDPDVLSLVMEHIQIYPNTRLCDLQKLLSSEQRYTSLSLSSLSRLRRKVMKELQGQIHPPVTSIDHHRPLRRKKSAIYSKGDRHHPSLDHGQTQNIYDTHINPRERPNRASGNEEKASLPARDQMYQITAKHLKYASLLQNSILRDGRAQNTHSLSHEAANSSSLDPVGSEIRHEVATQQTKTNSAQHTGSKHTKYVFHDSSHAVVPIESAATDSTSVQLAFEQPQEPYDSHRESHSNQATQMALSITAHLASGMKRKITQADSGAMNDTRNTEETHHDRFSRFLHSSQSADHEFSHGGDHCYVDVVSFHDLHQDADAYFAMAVSLKMLVYIVSLPVSPLAACLAQDLVSPENMMTGHPRILIPTPEDCTVISSLEMPKFSGLIHVNIPPSSTNRFSGMKDTPIHHIVNFIQQMLDLELDLHLHLQARGTKSHPEHSSMPQINRDSLTVSGSLNSNNLGPERVPQEDSNRHVPQTAVSSLHTDEHNRLNRNPINKPRMGLPLSSRNTNIQRPRNDIGGYLDIQARIESIVQHITQPALSYLYLQHLKGIAPSFDSWIALLSLPTHHTQHPQAQVTHGAEVSGDVEHMQDWDVSSFTLQPQSTSSPRINYIPASLASGDHHQHV
eukprot:TRINITY_DN15872_c0_g1_i1.p1 TRINITY_DN15872_c0_g1~~TRINITY_DN15872_c0_g1_i1.p1  ORF type:complete len:830 (+),score=126.91 TRINITY_DN15872_c0_g1_i1:51-2540(+)